MREPNVHVAAGAVAQLNQFAMFACQERRDPEKQSEGGGGGGILRLHLPSESALSWWSSWEAAMGTAACLGLVEVLSAGGAGSCFWRRGGWMLRNPCGERGRGETSGSFLRSLIFLAV